MVVNRFDIYLIKLDPVVGSEMRKTRPCVVISPDELNQNLRTAIIAPMSTKSHLYPTRVACRFQGKAGRIVIDQLRVVDQRRFIKKLGRLDKASSARALEVLSALFAP